MSTYGPLEPWTWGVMSHLRRACKTSQEASLRALFAFCAFIILYDPLCELPAFQLSHPQQSFARSLWSQGAWAEAVSWHHANHHDSKLNQNAMNFPKSPKTSQLPPRISVSYTSIDFEPISNPYRTRNQPVPNLYLNRTFRMGKTTSGFVAKSSGIFQTLRFCRFWSSRCIYI